MAASRVLLSSGSAAARRTIRQFERAKLLMKIFPVAPARLAAAALPVLLLAGAASARPESTPVSVAAPAATPAPPPMPAPAPAPEPVDEVDAATEAALKELSPSVERTSSPDALRNAFEAYYRYRAENGERVRKPYFWFVDLGLDNRTPRGWVFDMESLRLVEGAFTVAHGRGSSSGRNGVPTKFSNRSGSYMSSLGLYLAQETYTFRSSSYTAMGLRMRGESGEFNSAARARGIVAHGAPYVTRGDAGRSEGCPAMEMERARRLLPMIANGGVVFIYSPRDERWLEQDPWLQD